MLINSPIKREKNTMTAMVQIYCDLNHSQKALCPECHSFLDYALTRLEKCRFQPAKPTCAKCPVHCYKPDMRETAKKVMRFSGPKMLFRHPLLTFFHRLDSLFSNKKLRKQD